MIDDDDVGFVALIFADGRGWVGALMFIIAVSIAAYFASQNEKECAASSCASGKPELLDHRCVCVEPAKNSEDD